jgi:predicted metalloprotease with PDZ domain
MKAVYTKYYLKLNRGFTDDEFKKEANLIAGKDLNYIFDRYVYGTDSIPFNDFLSTVGLKIEQTNLNEMSPSIGATFTAVKNTVAIVTRNSPAWFAGLNVNDEVIAIDNYRVTDDIAKMIQGKPLNKTIKLLINRAGVLKEMDVMVMNLAKATFAISKIENSTPLQTQTYNSWIID